jgi:ribosomal protein L33
MKEMKIDVRLVKKQSKFPAVCTNCNSKIASDEIYYVEEGKKEHIHSLIARKFCKDCYAKYGERILIRGTKD